MKVSNWIDQDGYNLEIVGKNWRFGLWFGFGDAGYYLVGPSAIMQTWGWLWNSSWY